MVMLVGDALDARAGHGAAEAGRAWLAKGLAPRWDPLMPRLRPGRSYRFQCRRTGTTRPATEVIWERQNKHIQLNCTFVPRRLGWRSVHNSVAAGMTVTARPKRWHVGRLDRVDHLFGAAPARPRVLQR